jgi:hypothetical protein
MLQYGKDRGAIDLALLDARRAGITVLRTIAGLRVPVHPRDTSRGVMDRVAREWRWAEYQQHANDPSVNRQAIFLATQPLSV